LVLGSSSKSIFRRYILFTDVSVLIWNII
jgi:hypothetical protein